MRTWLLFIIVLVCSLMLTTYSLFWLHRPSHRVVAQWRQTKGVHYDDFDEYRLSVVESDTDWSGFPIHWEQNYFIYVGQDKGTPTHGHMIKYSFHPDDYNDIPKYIQRTFVSWASDGVTFHEASGHVLFIPKKMFIGGR